MTNWILSRLGEPSTWRGIVGLLTVFGLQIAPEQSNAIVAACVSIIAVIEIFRKEKPKAQ